MKFMRARRRLRHGAGSPPARIRHAAGLHESCRRSPGPVVTVPDATPISHRASSLICLVRTSIAFVAICLALLSAASAQPASTVATPGEALFLVSGRGYGHGVGMSQYGAYGQAKAGRTYRDILLYYFTGTEIGRAPTDKLRVLLAEGRSAAVVGSAAPFTAKDAAGRVFKLPAGAVTLGPELELPVAASAAVGDTKAATPPAKPRQPITFRPGKKSPLSLDGKQYRGQLEVATAGGFLRVIDVVGLESYLEGVVAGEMPEGWPTEALRAQAVAARSYALAKLVKGKPFDLYADPRSQTYLGVAGERATTSAAVLATRGEVVTYGGKVATTMYFSSSGGRTASAADVFGVSIPYLVSKPDPWDKASPYFRWGPVLLGARTLQSKLGADGRVVDAAGTPTPSGRIRSLVLQTVNGAETVPATLVRTALGLRSTWLRIGVLRLDRPSVSPTVFGTSVDLAGVARGVPAATLASSPDARSWAPVSAVAPDPSGALSFPVKPSRTTRYRIQAPGAATPALVIEVAPRLQLALGVDPSTITGTVRPATAGATVVLERRKGAEWVAVRQLTADATGAFRVEVTPGAYRARTSATDAFTAAVSPVLQVTG